MHLSLSLSPPPGICNGGRRKEEDGPTLVSPRFMRGGGGWKLGRTRDGSKTAREGGGLAPGLCPGSYPFHLSMRWRGDGGTDDMLFSSARPLLTD